MTKISALSQDTGPTVTDYIPTVDTENSTTKKVLLSDLITLLYAVTSEPTRHRNGWLDASSLATISYSSWDSTNKTGVLSTSADLTGFIGLGDRMTWSQSTGGTKYGIVTKITSTAITLYLGTDYTLNNETVSSAYYSHATDPLGFPLDPSKWTVRTTNTSDSSATWSAGTWNNTGTINITLPIGAWSVMYKAPIQLIRSGTGTGTIKATLSTATNTESDAELTAGFAVTWVTSVTNGSAAATLTIPRKTIVVTSATQYNLNGYSSAGSATTGGSFQGSSLGAIIIEAVCAYL